MGTDILKATSKALGHSTIALTGSTYAHMLDPQQREAMERTERYSREMRQKAAALQAK